MALGIVRRFGMVRITADGAPHAAQAGACRVVVKPTGLDGHLVLHGSMCRSELRATGSPPSGSALQLYDFRNGGPWVLNRTKQDLEAAGCYKGATVVVSCALRSREASGAFLAPTSALLPATCAVCA